MRYDLLKDEQQRVSEEQQQAVEAKPADAQSDEAKLAAEMQAAQAARIEEYKAADYDRRFEMQQALKSRMQAAGDHAPTIDHKQYEFLYAASESASVEHYVKEEMRLTAWETRKAVHELKQAEAAPPRDAAPTAAVQPAAKDSATDKRKADDADRTEQQRQAHNAKAQGGSTAAATKSAQQQGSQAGGEDLRHSSEKKAEQERASEARLRRLAEQFSGASHEATHRYTNRR